MLDNNIKLEIQILSQTTQSIVGEFLDQLDYSIDDERKPFQIAGILDGARCCTSTTPPKKENESLHFYLILHMHLHLHVHSPIQLNRQQY
jgi:hypothetical protein